MMKIVVVFVAIFLMLLIISTCYYDNEEYLFPEVNNQCDTTNVTFSLSVKSILQNNCYGCHSNSTSSLGGSIKLEDYADVKVYADKGKLLGSISHTSGYSPMPQGASKLEDCKITIIQKWLNDGKLNN